MKKPLRHPAPANHSDNTTHSAAGGAEQTPDLSQNANVERLPPLREVIAAPDLVPKKALGQNFILDLNLTRRIARCTGPLDGATVIEVGPGPGGLTRGLLLEGAQNVIAVERDSRCLNALAEIAAAAPGRLHVHAADALAVDWQRLLATSTNAEEADVRIIANLPYNVATALLTGWLSGAQWPPWYSAMALMFQREVAERIIAPPGNKTYGRLAVLAQWRCVPSITLQLPAHVFTPPPKVESSVVLFRPRRAPLPVGSPRTLARVTAAAFGQRRKMLRQSLKSLVRLPEVLLERAELEPTARAEQIDVAGFARLAAALHAIETNSR